MTVSRRRALVVAGVLGTALVGASAWRPTAYAADRLGKVDLETMFPRKLGNWFIDERILSPIISPDVAAVLNRLYSQTLSRTYVNERGDRLMLSVAYGGDQTDATRAHRPEVCYPAQGFQITASRNGAVNLDGGSFPARQLVAQRGSRHEPITFWIVVGNQVTLSGTEQKLAQLQYSVRGVIPDGMLVRVSTIDPDPERAFSVHADFLGDLRSSMTPESRTRVFGAGDA